MSISEIIKDRRATPPRLFSKKELSREIVEQLLENAAWAPNHKKTEPWRFKVYTGAAKAELAATCESVLRKQQAEGYPVSDEKIAKFSDTMVRVPVAIAIVMQTDQAHRLPEWEEVAAVAMAVQNMWLTATEMKLGAFWATPPFVNLLDDVIGLDEGQKTLGFFYVGEVMMDFPSPGRGDIALKTEWK